jgi:hypothetical protein
MAVQRFSISGAAIALNVAESFVVGLIESKALASTRVDGEDVVDVDVLTAFKRERDARRREGLRELVRLTEAFDGYRDER